MSAFLRSYIVSFRTAGLLSLTAATFLAAPVPAAAEGEIQEYLGYSYDPSVRALTVIRMDPDADSVLINENCYDLTEKQRVTLQGMPPKTEIAVYDQPGCGYVEENEVLTEGEVDCSDGEGSGEEKAEPLAEGTLEDLMDEEEAGMTAQKEKAEPQEQKKEEKAEEAAPEEEPDPFEEVRGKKITPNDAELSGNWEKEGFNRVTYTPDENAKELECDPASAMRYRYEAPVTGSYHIDVSIAGDCDSEECREDKGPYGVCIEVPDDLSKRMNTPKLYKMKMLPDEFMSLREGAIPHHSRFADPVVRLHKGAHDIIVYGAGTPVRFGDITVRDLAELEEAGATNDRNAAPAPARASAFRTGGMAEESGAETGERACAYSPATGEMKEENKAPSSTEGLPIPLACDESNIITMHYTPVFEGEDKAAVTAENYVNGPVTMFVDGGHSSICPDEASEMKITAMISRSGDDAADIEPMKIHGFFAGSMGRPGCSLDDLLNGAGAESDACECGNVWAFRFAPAEDGEYTAKIQADDRFDIDASVEAIAFDVSPEYMGKTALSAEGDFYERGRIRHSDTGYIRFGEDGDFFVPADFGTPKNLFLDGDKNIVTTFSDWEETQRCSLYDYMARVYEEGFSSHTVAPDPGTLSVANKFLYNNLFEFMNAHGIAVRYELAAGADDVYYREAAKAFSHNNGIIWLPGNERAEAALKEYDAYGNPGASVSDMLQDVSGGAEGEEQLSPIETTMIPAFIGGATGMTWTPQVEGYNFWLPWEHIGKDVTVRTVEFTDRMEQALLCLSNSLPGASIVALPCAENEHCVMLSDGKMGIEILHDAESDMFVFDPPYQGAGVCELKAVPEELLGGGLRDDTGKEPEKKEEYGDGSADNPFRAKTGSDEPWAHLDGGAPDIITRPGCYTSREYEMKNPKFNAEFAKKMLDLAKEALDANPQDKKNIALTAPRRAVDKLLNDAGSDMVDAIGMALIEGSGYLDIFVEDFSFRYVEHLRDIDHAQKGEVTAERVAADTLSYLAEHKYEIVKGAFGKSCTEAVMLSEKPEEMQEPEMPAETPADDGKDGGEMQKEEKEKADYGDGTTENPFRAGTGTSEPWAHLDGGAPDMITRLSCYESRVYEMKDPQFNATFARKMLDLAKEALANNPPDKKNIALTAPRRAVDKLANDAGSDMIDAIGMALIEGSGYLDMFVEDFSFRYVSHLRNSEHPQADTVTAARVAQDTLAYLKNKKRGIIVNSFGRACADSVQATEQPPMPEPVPASE